MPAPPNRRSVFLGRLSLPERTYLADALRTETLGGVLLLVAAVIALILSNSPLHDVYTSVRDFRIGPEALSLHLSLADWAKDGLLTVFFFVAGIELKRELVAGDLRSPAAAALPVIAAACGMAVPAACYVATVAAGGGSLDGWAVPTATDIAFALAVLAVIGTGLPSALRAFLLTLAVVDDLGAILVIALFYTAQLNLLALGGAALGLLAFYGLLRAGVHGWYVFVPLGLVIWGLMHASGVHATIAGVAMGLMLRCGRREGEEHSPGERIEHLTRPLSAGLAVPLFALVAAGVSVSGGAVHKVFTQPEPLGVVLGLLVGKTVGIFGGSWLAARFTRARLGDGLEWADVFAVAVLAGIGFTVSLLIGELAFPEDPDLVEQVKGAVLIGSVLSALVASILIKLRNNHYRRILDEEERDEDADHIPDIYQQDDAAWHMRMAGVHARMAVRHREAARSQPPDRRPSDRQSPDRPRPEGERTSGHEHEQRPGKTSGEPSTKPSGDAD